MRTIRGHLPIIAMLSCIVASCCAAGQWYVGPNGSRANPGTVDRPWDIGSALEAGGKVRPGDTVYLLEGTYKRRPEALFNPIETGPTRAGKPVCQLNPEAFAIALAPASSL